MCQEIVILCLLLLLVIYSISMFINNWSRNYRDINQTAYIVASQETEEGEDPEAAHLTASKSLQGAFLVWWLLFISSPALGPWWGPQPGGEQNVQTVTSSAGQSSSWVAMTMTMTMSLFRPRVFWRRAAETDPLSAPWPATASSPRPRQKATAPQTCFTRPELQTWSSWDRPRRIQTPKSNISTALRLIAKTWQIF